MNSLYSLLAIPPILRCRLFVTCVAMLEMNTSLHAGWNIHVVDTPVGDYQDTSIALNGANLPSVSYRAVNEGLKFATFNGTSWATSTVDAAGARYTSLALDGLGRAHISYQQSGALRYAAYDGSSWNLSTVDSSSGGYTSIALDSLGHAHISYRSNGALKYAYYDGSSWNMSIVDSLANVGTWTSLALDNLGHAHISYYDLTNQDLKYAAFNGSSWALTTVDSTGDVGEGSSLRLDSAGHARIGYLDDMNNDLKYAAFDGVSWSVSVIDPAAGSIAGTKGNVDLALDSADRPRIAYHAGWGHGNGLHYASFDGAA